MLRAMAQAAPPAQELATRSLNLAFQIDPARGAFVTYSIQQVVTASIVSGQSGQCALEIAKDQAFTQNVQTIAISPGSQTYTLAIALQGVQNMPCSLMGYVPPGYWVMLKTIDIIGVPPFTYLAGQETLVF